MRAEATPLFAQLLATLEAHGAGTVEGFQIKQEELAELAGYASKRSLYSHLKKAKAHGLVTITPQARGSGSDLVREPDRYHLKVTSAEWAERRDALVEELEKDSRARGGAKSKVAQMERNRLVKQALRRQGGGRAAPAAVDLDPAAIAVRVAQMGPDEDLTGW